MKLLNIPVRLLVLGLIGTLVLWSCNDEDPLTLLPVDQAPAITLISPANSSLLRELDEDFTVTVQVADNEALKLLRLTAEIYDQNDLQIGSSFLVRDIEVSGTNVILDITDKVPQGALPFYKVKYTCYVIDSKGEVSSAFFWVSVLPPPSEPPVFEIRSYTGDSIFNSEATFGRGFNFTNREILPNPTRQGSDLDYDILEVSKTARQLYRPRLSSPSNDFFDRDSIFVITNSTKFNFEEATYQTLFNAFYSDPAPFTITPALEVGDLVIVRLTKAPRPQFAVMRIIDIKDDGAGTFNVRDVLRFDYKVTAKP